MMCKIVRFQKLMWRNMMKSTKSQKVSVLHYRIDSESSGNMNFKCNYMDVHFFYLLFWILICNLKDHLMAMDILYYP